VAKQRRRATEAEASALASGIRLRIIRLTYSEALTNKELAQRLGRDPATVLHHVRRLVETGFLAPQAERRGTRGAKEIPYLSTGMSWMLDNGEGDGTSLAEAMLEAYLAEVAEIAPPELRQTRLVLELAEDDRREFENRLDELLEEYRVRRPGRSAERSAVYIALYPSR